MLLTVTSAKENAKSESHSMVVCTNDLVVRLDKTGGKFVARQES